ncbi:MAG: hypothetical protein M3R51_08395 [Candidatus Eremiobacteraeota bacterium]|nr:hypothetical protein [Candidatus Eremiobacteraeota bacterium]
MQRLLRTAAAAIALTAIAVPAAAGQRVAVNGGTPIEIRMVDTISSGTAHPGDAFEFRANTDIVSNGWIVVPKGAAGHGTVVEAESAGGNGHSGHLKLTFDYVYAADGEKIKLTDVGKTSEASGEHGKSSTAAIIGYMALGPVGLFAHNWVKGKEFVLDPEKPFTVFVDNTVHVVASQRSGATGDGFAH